VDVAALQAYASRAHSRAPQLHVLARFIDSKPRVMPQEVYEMQRAASAAELGTTAVPAATTAGGGGVPRGGWDPSAGQIDWSLLNGSREVSLSVGETAASLPDTDTGREAAIRLLGGAHGGAFAEQRRTDRRTGHRLDFALPRAGERFLRDAHYMRIEDLRKSQQGKAPSKRLPAPVLYNGECREQQPRDANQAAVVDAHRRAQRARAEHLAERTKHKWAPTGSVDPARDEWTGAQRKRATSAGQQRNSLDTAARVFHTDLPVDAHGLRGLPRSAAALAREQNLRDRSSHGRDFDVLSSVRITTVPPSNEAQQRLKLSGPNAVGRHHMDQRRIFEAQQQQQSAPRSEAVQG
jgi:hypothetical protein